jgi:type IV/VI secretion system ImpK/VasF family protein
MTLLELCEPLFQYICMLNRIARNPGGEDLEFNALRKQIEGLLAQLKEAAAEDSRLLAQFQKVELPLIFFVDSMIAESRLKLRMQWHKNRMAYERNELAGDEKFFDFLDETLAEKGPEANERLGVYYTCLGLGFVGWYAGQPEHLRKKMLEIAQRLPPEVIEPQQNARLTPEAYGHTDARNLIEPPGVKLATMAIAFVGLCLVVFFVNFYLFHTASRGLAESLAEILRHDLSAISAGK